MSYWTRVAGYIDVSIPHNTYIQEKVQKYIEWAITDLEKNGHFVSGSEGNVMFTVVPATCKGWNSEAYSGDNYSNATIFMNTNLRDRMEDRVMIELKDFTRNLLRYMNINHMSINVGYKSLVAVEEEYVNEHESKEFEDVLILSNSIEDKNGCDKFFKVQYHNWMRWNERMYNNYDRIKDAVECLVSLTPQKLEDVLNNSSLNRVIDWDFNEHVYSWQKYVGQKCPE